MSYDLTILINNVPQTLSISGSDAFRMVGLTCTFLSLVSASHLLVESGLKKLYRDDTLSENRYTGTSYAVSGWIMLALSKLI